jgi:hypothetical protein
LNESKIHFHIFNLKNLNWFNCSKTWSQQHYHCPSTTHQTFNCFACTHLSFDCTRERKNERTEQNQHWLRENDKFSTFYWIVFFSSSPHLQHVPLWRSDAISLILMKRKFGNEMSKFQRVSLSNANWSSIDIFKEKI